MHNPSLYKQLITARTDDIRRISHGRAAARANPMPASSVDSAGQRDPRVPVLPRRMFARFAH